MVLSGSAPTTSGTKSPMNHRNAGWKKQILVHRCDGQDLEEINALDSESAGGKTDSRRTRSQFRTEPDG